MKIFIGAMLGLLIGNIVLKLTWLAKGEAPGRKLSHEAADVALYVGFMAWGIVVTLC